MMPTPPPSPHKPPKPRSPPPLRPRIRYIQCPIEYVYSLENEETEEIKYYKPCGKTYTGETATCTERSYHECPDYGTYELEQYIIRKRTEWEKWKEDNPEWDKDLEEVVDKEDGKEETED